MSAQNMTRGNVGSVEVDGARLQYVIEGQGPPCLVVGSSVYYPRVFSQGLREHLQLIFIDLRHFGVVDPSFEPGSISIETYVDDIEQVRQTLELSHMAVIGHSIHGTIALEYARRYPKWVRGVVVIGSPPHRSRDQDANRDHFWEEDASEDRKEILARQVARLTPELLATLSPTELMAREATAYAPMNWYDPTYDGAWLWAGVIPDMPIAERLFGEVFQPYDLTQGQGTITTPVLIVHGRYDYTVPYTLWDEHGHKLSRHTYVLFERSGHTPPLEEQERFDETFLTWIRDLEEATSGQGSVSEPAADRKAVALLKEKSD